MFDRFPDEIPILESERLILRKTTDEDLNDIIPIVCYQGTYAANIEDAKILLGKLHAKYENKIQLHWGIVLKENNKMIGSCDLYNFENNTGEIGIVVMAEVRNKGIATEAISAMIDYGFKTLKLGGICAYVYDVRVASKAIMKKLNFTEVESDEEDQRKYLFKA